MASVWIEPSHLSFWSLNLQSLYAVMMCRGVLSSTSETSWEIDAIGPAHEGSTSITEM